MITLYACDQCENIDDYDLTYATFLGSDLSKKPHPLLCSKCLTGRWHGHWEERKYDSDVDYVINRADTMGVSL